MRKIKEGMNIASLIGLMFNEKGRWILENI